MHLLFKHLLSILGQRGPFLMWKIFVYPLCEIIISTIYYELSVWVDVFVSQGQCWMGKDNGGCVTWEADSAASGKRKYISLFTFLSPSVSSPKCYLMSEEVNKNIFFTGNLLSVTAYRCGPFLWFNFQIGSGFFELVTSNLPNLPNMVQLWPKGFLLLVKLVGKWKAIRNVLGT